MAKVLIVEDQPAVRTALEILFEVHQIAASSVGTPKEALAVIRREDIAVVLQDMNFSEGTTSGEEGVELFRALRAIDPELPIVLMTAWTSLETAVALVKEGAADYLAKPWNDDKLVATVRNCLRLHELREENDRLRRESGRARRALASTHDLRGLVYQSAAMHEVVSLAVHVAGADVPVLITGPNGSGKEKLAEIVQANSRRRGKPFIKVNAGAIPDNLLESELFGAEAGAFTGAGKMRVGHFEAADGGTLFLDEVGNLSLAGQQKLLRVLQTGEYQRLGSSATKRCDVRVISATNADLQRAIADKTFREDLYFRLNVIELRVPPLAERRDDIVPLAEHLLAAVTDVKAPPLSDAARTALVQHDWPGNVRELQNCIRRASLVARGAAIEPGDLGLQVQARRSTAPPQHEEHDVDRTTLEGALARHAGNVSRVAAELGLSRQALYRRMERAGIVIERRTKAT